MAQIPRTLFSNITDVHGDRGRAWLDQLPDLIRRIEHDWSIQAGRPLDQLTYHFVAPASLENEQEVMLKLGVPGSQIENEAECLQAYAGRGVVKLLRCDLSLAALLLERVKPGSNIKDLDEEEAVRAATHVMTRLHRAEEPQAKLPTIADWGEAFQRLREGCGGETGPLPPAMVDQAEELFFSLADSMDGSVLLHGDLHHENILSSHRDHWLAIDPQGVMGEPCYEIGAFLRNPLPEILGWPNLAVIIRNRVALFSELTGFDRDRIMGWGFCQSVLSAIWSIEDHGSGWEGGIQFAEAIREASTKAAGSGGFT